MPYVDEPDGEKYTIRVTFGNAKPFSSFIQRKFQFYPYNEHTGTYKIVIVLTDNNDVPLSSMYTFDVTVLPSSKNYVPIFEGITIPKEPDVNATQADKDRYA